MVDLKWDREFALRQVDNDENFLEYCLKLFLDSAHEDLAKMESALSQEEIAQIKRAAHSLKGAALNIGMNGIMEVALDTEKAALANDLETVEKNLALLHELVELVSKSCSNNK